MLIVSPAFCQTFVTTIHTELDEVAGKPLELEDGSFLVPAARGTYNPDQPELTGYQEYLYRVSPEGNVIDSAIIEVESAFTSGSLKLMQYNDHIFFYSSIHDTGEILRPGGLRYGFLSEDLEVEKETILFVPDTGRQFNDCLVNNDNNLIFVGNEFGWFTEHQSGIIWEIHPEQGIIRKSAVENDALYFHNIVDIPAFQKYHVCGITRNCQFSYDLDFEGIVFTQPMEDTIFEYYGSQSLTDSTYARCAIGFEFPSGDFQDFGIGIFGDSGQKKKAHTLGMAGMNDYARSLDSHHPDSLIVGGTLGGPLAAMDKKFEVINFRPSSGELNWQVCYGDSGAYEVSSVLATRDGGCLIAGTYWDWRNHPTKERDVILLKVNRQGQLVGMEEDPGTSLTNHSVYPNPGNDALYLECRPSDGVFRLYDSYGRQVVERNFSSGRLKLDTSGLAKGLYQYLILVDNRAVYSGKWIKISD